MENLFRAEIVGEAEGILHRLEAPFVMPFGAARSGGVGMRIGSRSR